ncbi:hypothetical protein [Flavobacterium sp. MK4S-17]|uniref:hypothetical protein n=1 Tax=Flavobacterium sp. MK4S-17 TaxID=2543737 RepID=UPI001359AF5C|nr:hypothetical protein [Flavobacterium sp. MK4S-17]
MIKKIIVSFSLLAASVAFAQENNASPYSYYGIGDVKFKGTAENRAMGGLGILSDSIHLNLQNPASYSALKFTTFSIAASTSSTTFKTSSGNDDASRTTVDYLAVGLPVNNLAFAFGLMPYSAVGYKIRNSVIDDNGFERARRFEGSGGLNRVFLGASYNITPKFSLGADFQYNFGDIETRSAVSIPGLEYSTRELNNSDYSGFSFNIGAIYKTRLKEKYDWYTSATYTPAGTLNSSTERELATIYYSRSGNEIVVEKLGVRSFDGDVKTPSKISLGSGIGQNLKWFAGVEYTFQESNELGNRFDNITNAGFEQSHKVAVGGYYIPRYMSFSSYLSRVTYRAGFKYEKTGLVVNGESINDYGVSFGMGLPLGSYIGSSNLNIGVEYGKRGTTNANLVQENYVNLFVSLSLNDKWFVKRKYD